MVLATSAVVDIQLPFRAWQSVSKLRSTRLEVLGLLYEFVCLEQESIHAKYSVPVALNLFNRF